MPMAESPLYDTVHTIRITKITIAYWISCQWAAELVLTVEKVTALHRIFLLSCLCAIKVFEPRSPLVFQICILRPCSWERWHWLALMVLNFIRRTLHGSNLEIFKVGHITNPLLS